MDCSPPGPSVHGILQARILQWVVTPSPGTWVERRPDLQGSLGCPASGKVTSQRSRTQDPWPGQSSLCAQNFIGVSRHSTLGNYSDQQRLPVISPLRQAKNILVTHQYSRVTWGLVTCYPRGAGNPSFCLGPGKTLAPFYFPEDGKSTF